VQGGYTDAFEIICCDCGDHPDLDYRDASLELQRVRGLYPIAAGITAYQEHLKQYHGQQPARRPGRPMHDATNMNVAISAIAHDLGTTVAGVQTAITLFTLTMAALMIPGSKLTDIWAAGGASCSAWPSTGSVAC
jgi:hypothetical protein